MIFCKMSPWSPQLFVTKSLVIVMLEHKSHAEIGVSCFNNYQSGFHSSMKAIQYTILPLTSTPSIRFPLSNK